MCAIDLGKTNLSSRAPTNEYIIRKGQALADQFYDQSINLRAARTGPTSYIVWSFDVVEIEEFNAQKGLRDIHLAQPRWCRVRELSVHSEENRHFVNCSCGKRTTLGLPCNHFFKIARDANIPTSQIMDIGMFDVRWLKIFNSNYGEEQNGKPTELAKLLYSAQAQCFASEGKGIQISDGTDVSVLTFFYGFLTYYSMVNVNSKLTFSFCRIQDITPGKRNRGNVSSYLREHNKRRVQRGHVGTEPSEE